MSLDQLTEAAKRVHRHHPGLAAAVPMRTAAPEDLPAEFSRVDEMFVHRSGRVLPIISECTEQVDSIRDVPAMRVIPFSDSSPLKAN